MPSPSAAATLGLQFQHATRGLPSRGSFIAIPLLMCALRDCAHSCSECDAGGVFWDTRSTRPVGPAVLTLGRAAFGGRVFAALARGDGVALLAHLRRALQPTRPATHRRWSAFAVSLHKPSPKSHRRHKVDRQLCIRGHMTCSHVYAQQRPSRCARCSIFRAVAGVLVVRLRVVAAHERRARPGDPAAAPRAAHDDRRSRARRRHAPDIPVRY